MAFISSTWKAVASKSEFEISLVYRVEFQDSIINYEKDILTKIVFFFNTKVRWDSSTLRR